MTTNFSQIVANVRSTLAAIVSGAGPAPGYFNTIVTVSGEAKTYDAFAASELPAVCVFPSATSRPAPIYAAFQNIEKNLDIEIWGHVANTQDDQTDKALQIGELEEDIRRALQVDSRRGGWAVDTVEVEDFDTDVGTKDDINKDFGSTSLRVVFRCTYYPND